jgi:hypothetical protein
MRIACHPVRNVSIHHYTLADWALGAPFAEISVDNEDRAGPELEAVG